MRSQPTLFDVDEKLPEGFRYAPDALSRAEEQTLIEAFQGLPFKEFEFHGFLGKRRVVSYGWRYDYNEGALQKVQDIPDFLLPAREKAAAFAGLPAEELQQALLTEYPAGATIGWHRDRPVFAEVVGLSLLSPCVFRLRRKRGATWERSSLVVEPRSVYLLSGPARTQWQHSIPAVKDRRFSITFRRFKAV